MSGFAGGFGVGAVLLSVVAAAEHSDTVALLAIVWALLFVGLCIAADRGTP